MDSPADIKENDLASLSPELLSTLLKDHTRSTPEEQQNIFWATDDYAHLGAAYAYHAPIMPELITGEHGNVIQPRVLKARERQAARSKDMAEVFTPSWLCNAQNNLIDEAWFGRKGVFNEELTTEDGRHTWLTTSEPIAFPEGKTWRDYVRDTRMEITCGEAPYLASRYDATTGDTIPLPDRIGLLDRKLRVVGENTEGSGDWLTWAQAALKSTYAYEWQGDSLLLARENLLATFSEHYEARFGQKPLTRSLLYAAYIISWNVIQMDGLRGVIPDTCGMKPTAQLSIFDEPEMQPCEGCRTGDPRRHNGTYALVRDWAARPPKDRIRFIDLLRP